MVHVPTVMVVTVELDTAHTRGVLEVNETCSPEVALADRVICALTCVSDGWAKVIVCPSFTMNLRCAWAGA